MYGLGGHVPQLGDAAGDQDRLKFLQGQLHATALAISQARGRGDAAAIAKLQTLFAGILLEMRQIFARLFKADLPGPIMQGLQNLSDGIEKLAGQTLKAAQQGIETIGRSLVWPLAAAAAVVGVILLPRYLPKARGAANPRHYGDLLKNPRRRRRGR